jgi:hypothetical protein
MNCRHCQRCPISRPRGLCWTCFYTPEVRALYPPQKLPRGVADGFDRRPPPPWPTTTRPGSPAKVEVLCQRASQRYQLWHPDDAR